MKRFYSICSLILTFILLAPIPVKAADTDFSGGTNKWKVEFTTKDEMVSTFDGESFNDIIDQMQPGDSVLFTVDLENLNEETTRWYMTNSVLKSLEEVTKEKRSAASSGAYTYILKYVNNDGTETEIFNSDTVGGEKQEESANDDLLGLNEATDNLEDYFYLDTLDTNEGGQITLLVALDGETQGNSYQDTRAQLQMNFAVELDDKNSKKTTTKKKIVKKTKRGSVAKTGDDTNWNMYFLLAAISGVGLLCLGYYGKKLREEEEDA